MARIEDLLPRLKNYNFSVRNISRTNNEYILAKLYNYETDSSNTVSHFNQANILYIIHASQLHKIMDLSNLDAAIGFFIIRDEEYYINLNKDVGVVDFAKGTNGYQLLEDTIEIMNSLNKIDIVKKEIFECLLSNCDTQGLLETVSKYIDNPIMLFNLSTNILAASKKETLLAKGDYAIAETLKKGYNSYKTFKEYNILEIINRVKQSKTPFIHIRPGETTQRLLFRIQVNKKMIGFLSVQGLVRDFNNEDLLIIQYLSKALSVKLRISPDEINFNEEANANVLIELIENKHRSFSILEERTKPYSWKLTGSYFMLSIVPKPDDKSNREINLQALGRYIFDILPFISVYYEGRLIVLIRQEQGVTLSNDMLNSIIMFLEENGLIAGLSQCFKNILELHKYYKQSLKMIELGLILKKPATLFVHYDLYIQDIIFEISKFFDLQDFCLPRIRKLKEDDVELYYTLATYLKSGQDMYKACNVLYVHINTLRNRLRKISSIIDTDLEDGTNCAKLYISILIMDIQEKIKKEK